MTAWKTSVGRSTIPISNADISVNRLRRTSMWPLRNKYVEHASLAYYKTWLTLLGRIFVDVSIQIGKSMSVRIISPELKTAEALIDSLHKPWDSGLNYMEHNYRSLDGQSPNEHFPYGEPIKRPFQRRRTRGQSRFRRHSMLECIFAFSEFE
jgi:hypothetical protein